jgi:predicted Rossmann fold flavoprotein
MRFDVVIVGGGAAGLFCAAEAGKRGRRVAVIEHNAEVGRKILISGGGRCNFTNVHTAPENFISKNPHFAKSALARYTPQDFISLVRRYKIDFYEKTLGQMFCRTSSREIVDMLLEECKGFAVTIMTNCRVDSVTHDMGFELGTSRGVIKCEKLVIATGGLSFRKIGATDFGYRIARQFGLKITETRPSLVALVFDNKAAYSSLSGVAIPAEVSDGKHRFRENILFTHRGLSGPATLQISNYWDKNHPIRIDLLPSLDAASLLTATDSQRSTGNFLGKLLPARFADAFIDPDLARKPVNKLNKKEIGLLADSLNSWMVRFSDTEGYDRAEVTLGGVSTAELSSQTMESKNQPGLYFIGEVVDVTGWLGGYNFQWAWASAFAAGQAV